MAVLAHSPKGYGPFFLENRINESNFYAEDNWKLATEFDFEPGCSLRIRFSAKEVENRLDYLYGADKNNIEPRVGFCVES